MSLFISQMKNKLNFLKVSLYFFRPLKQIVSQLLFKIVYLYLYFQLQNQSTSSFKTFSKPVNQISKPLPLFQNHLTKFPKKNDVFLIV